MVANIASPHEFMNILGIDPGLHRCGWAIISVQVARPANLRPLAGGVIETGRGLQPTPRDDQPAEKAAQSKAQLVDFAMSKLPRAKTSRRLAVLDNRLTALLQEYPVHLAAMETTYVNRNPRTSLLLAQARGALIAVLGRADIPTADYAPRTVKKTVAGHGNADKGMVQKMVRAHLPTLTEMTTDQSDAFAVALCHAQHCPWREVLQQSNRLA